MNKVKNEKQLDMKTTKTIWKAGLAAMFLMATLGARGQQIEKDPVNVGPSTAPANQGRIDAFAADAISTDPENTHSVLFFRPGGSGVTLVASRTEDLSTITPPTSRPAETFTHYRWFYMGFDGLAEAEGTEYNTALDINGHLVKYENDGDNKLTLTELKEGYHYFKVQGIVNPNDIENFEGCDIQEEVFVVFVLPQLQVNVTANSMLTDGTDEVFQFCETEGQAGHQENVSITATYSFINGSLPATTPAAGDFEVKYRYYAVPASTDDITIDNAAIDPMSYGTLLGTESTATGSPLAQFLPQITEVGQYKILVEIEYALKNRNYENDDESGDRVRPYVIYRNLAQASTSTGTDDLIVTVTPQPGKPHITVESVID